MHVDELVARVPRLFHTTPATAWPAIERHGLLPPDRLTRLFGTADDERERLLTTRRPDAVRLTHPDHGTAWLRDQRPCNTAHLARMLDGSSMTVADYLRRTNSLAFLWADRARVDRLRSLPRYAHEPHLVVVVDTASLLAAHGDRTVLTRINSGAALFPSGRRGPDTFRTVAEFPTTDTPVEIGVEGGVPDLRRHVVAIEHGPGPGPPHPPGTHAPEVASRGASGA